MPELFLFFSRQKTTLRNSLTNVDLSEVFHDLVEEKLIFLVMKQSLKLIGLHIL